MQNADAKRQVTTAGGTQPPGGVVRGQRSTQSITPSPSVSKVSSQTSGIPSASQSGSHSSGTLFVLQSRLVPSTISQMSSVPLWLQSGSHSSGIMLKLQSTLSPQGAPQPGAAQSTSQMSPIPLVLQSTNPDDAGARVSI